MLQIKQGTPQCQLFTNPVGAVSDQRDVPQGPPPPLFLDQTEAESMDPPLWSKPRYIATFLKPGKKDTLGQSNSHIRPPCTKFSVNL